ncbi:sigma-54 interaction domain-containing protein [Neobacillus citreus]|uniref:Sigma 54-interacting transcriptional regulator n=1 Tax=Neobacillus citreus TaxID=2833578 RepID=A0A942TB94_9BACI|nr:sigma 54-interacting transcriptional regulator [Neobacillus citreus]MCH6266963.1 sigma 54-interacting transcriptional regulator [Neobacillus citreus]
MFFPIQTAKDIVKELPDTASGLMHLTMINKKYYYAPSDNTSLIPCKVVHEDDSIESLIHSFQDDSVTILLNENEQPAACITAGHMIAFLFSTYRQLLAFYETVIATTDSSVTVIDAKETVRTWTKGAEKIFSVKQQEIIGKPITDFFDKNKLEILQTLHKGKRITGQYHQPRSDLFVLINTNPVTFNNRIIGAVVSETDVTNQVMLNEKLFNMSNEVRRLEQEVAKYNHSNDPFRFIKGTSAAIQHTIEMARKVCTVKSTVLILGESGVGKEVFARAIHEASEKPNAPFITINCGAIPASLFESELFGYERGAFSGADYKGKKGKIELAKGGTLFLDEIGEMPLEMQVKLLRVLQERKFYRVGGEKEINIDFRVIAATNRDLQELMRQGEFREDLYYRLNVVTLYIPPLRERPGDIIELTHYYLNEFAKSYSRPIHEFTPDVMQAMLHYDWPGNIRELRNMAERLVVFATDGVIRAEYLRFSSAGTDQNTPKLQTVDRVIETNDTIVSLQEEMDQHERRVIERALQIANGNKLECAKRLGITRATLYNRLKRLGLD